MEGGQGFTMGRGASVSIRAYNEFTESYSITKTRNDLKSAQNAKKLSDLQNLVGGKWDNSGAVGREIKNRGLVVYGADGKPRVDEQAVLRAAEQAKQQTISAREYPKEVLDREIDEIAQRDGISRKDAKALIKRREQIQAQAILTAANTGKVKIDSYTKGILNNYAAGRYEQAIYGTEDERGKRQFERGTTFRSFRPDEVEFKGASSAVNTQAAKAEKRKDFIQNVQARSGGSSGKGKGIAELTGKESSFSMEKQLADFRAGIAQENRRNFDDEPPF